MTDEHAQIVRQRVENYLSSKDGRTLDIGSPSHLALLVQHARNDDELPEDELRLTVAMCWLGPPPTEGIPPTSMREELQKVISEAVPDTQERLERVMEFVIAYGCGKWREVQSGFGGWRHRWQGAMRGLARALEPAVAQANRWLAQHVVGFPQTRHLAWSEHFTEDTGVWSDAWLLAARVTRPEQALQVHAQEILTIACTQEGTDLQVAEQEYQSFIPPGAKAVWTVKETQGPVFISAAQTLPLSAATTLLFIVRDEDMILKAATAVQEQQIRLKIGEAVELAGPLAFSVRECTCGTTHCMGRHRLTAWNPRQIIQRTGAATGQKVDAALTLWDYLASAVKGPQANLKTGAFVQGMYFPVLAKEGVNT